MKAEHVNPFIEASKSVLKQIANIDSNIGKLFIKNSPYSSESVLIIVGITGDIKGQVTFSMSKELALSIASGMMGGFEVLEFDEISRSAISEMTNMILGNSATLLYNQGVKIDITPPSLLMGTNIQISQSDMQTICVPLIMPGGESLDIDISVKE